MSDTTVKHREKSYFCRLDRGSEYLPCHWDFSEHRDSLEYFAPFFRQQFDRSLMLAGRQIPQIDGLPAAFELAAGRCRTQFNAFLDRLLDNPEAHVRPTILTIDYERDRILRSAGFHDPYYEVKHHDNEQVIGLLAEVCRDIDSHCGPDRLRAAIEGALAGNIFDMGVAATAQRMMEKSLSFIHTRDNLPRRPWCVDDFDALRRRMENGRPHRKAILFVDNAGADFILGMLPLARYLALRGSEVVIVGNELPALNDMTLADMREIWPKIIAAEPSFAQLPIRLASSGTGEPLIDLREVSPELNTLAADADLVILEGMGRALESNYFTRFDCDCLKLAMIKDEYVARWLGGKMYDVVCRFEPK